MNTQAFCNYTLLNELGRGGVSTVYRARDNRSGTLVALKVLNKQMQSDASVRERFRREPKFQFLHPKIVPVIEADSCAGQMYFTMELVEGESLERRIQRGPLTPRQMYPYLRDVADALDTAHQRGIVHRDIKPSNILIRASSDTALLTDFGVAKLTGSTASPIAAPITQAALHLVGTADYVSPEVARGIGDVTRASDIYSLGVTAYYALAGRLPFVTDNPLIVAHKHANEAPPALHRVNPSIPDNVSRVVMQALNKNPNERYASAGAFANVFTEAVMQSQGRPVLAVPPNRLLWGGLAAVGVIAVVGLAVILSKVSADTSPPPIPAMTATHPIGASATSLPAAAILPTLTDAPATVSSLATTLPTSEPVPAATASPVAEETVEEAATATLEPTATSLPPTSTPDAAKTTPVGNATTTGGKAEKPSDKTMAVVYNGGSYMPWGQPIGVCGKDGFDDNQQGFRFEVNLNLSNTSPQDTLAGLSAQFFDSAGNAMLTCHIQDTEPLQPKQMATIKLATYTKVKNVGSVTVSLGGARQKLCFSDTAAQICA